MDKIKIKTMKKIDSIDVSVVSMNMNRKYRVYPKNIRTENEVAIQNGASIDQYFIKIIGRCYNADEEDNIEEKENTQDDKEISEEIANYEVTFFIDSEFEDGYIEKLLKKAKKKELGKEKCICEILNAIIISAFPHMKKYLSFMANTLELADNIEVYNFIQTFEDIQKGIIAE